MEVVEVMRYAVTSFNSSLADFVDTDVRDEGRPAETKRHRSVSQSAAVFKADAKELAGGGRDLVVAEEHVAQVVGGMMAVVGNQALNGLVGLHVELGGGACRQR